MPKEIVEAAHQDGPFAVRVGWSGEGGHVQIATVTHQERSMWWQTLGYNEDIQAEFGAKIREIVAAGSAIDDGQKGRPEVTDRELAHNILNWMDVWRNSDGLYVGLDRTGCNRVIRLLRKARDAAFGRDE